MKLESVDNPIIVQSSTVDLGDSFREYAEKGILRTASKYFGRLNSASVYVNHDGPYFRCTVNLQVASQNIMTGENSERDCYAAFKGALEKVDKQLRRAKRELREDKAVRTDKDQLLREGMSAPSSM